MTKNMTCIICPLGCQVTVTDGTVRGHSCPRGREWALQETISPERTLTTTVALETGELELLPVRTAVPVPKDKLRDCLFHARRLRVKAPVKAGQVVCPDLGGTGVALTATRTIGSA